MSKQNNNSGFWKCPHYEANSYKRIELVIGKIIDPIHGGNKIDKTISTGLYECCGCSRVFGDPVKFNKGVSGW